MDASQESYRRDLDLMASAAPLRAAVIGAGYWGPNLARNFKSSPDWELVAVVRPGPATGPPSSRQRTAVSRSATSVDELLDTDDVDAVAIATPARTHHGSPWRRSRRASTCWSRSRWPTAGPRAWRWSTQPRTRPGPDGRPHLLLHPGRAEDPRADRGRRAGRDPLRRLGPDQPRTDPAGRRRLLGPGARTTCRSSTSSCPAASGPSRWRRTAPIRSAPGKPASAT